MYFEFPKGKMAEFETNAGTRLQPVPEHVGKLRYRPERQVVRPDLGQRSGPIMKLVLTG